VWFTDRMADVLSIADYFERIGYTGTREPSLANLRALHRAHLLNVPFENLDVVITKAPIRLEADALAEKIVRRRRGGFCFELNGLFSMLLTELGYRTTLYPAQVHRDDGTIGRRGGHVVCFVSFPDGTRWLADVGTGDMFFEPIPLVLGEVTTESLADFRIVDCEDGRLAAQRRDALTPAWHTRYKIDLQPRALGDFADVCEWTRTSSESFFTQRRLCTQPFENGRITISDSKLIRTLARDGTLQKLETVLPSEAAFQQAIWEHFGLKL
jgi:N-hydroxyarylamine O-acetyltransferase